jgi:hypothetical protein
MTVSFAFFRKEERLRHLFFKCSFARNYWAQIGVNVSSWLKPERATRHIKRILRVSFAMKIIILMCWCIWSQRNAWLFQNEDPQVFKCKDHLKRSLAWLSIGQKEVGQMKCNHGYVILFSFQGSLLVFLFCLFV